MLLLGVSVVTACTNEEASVPVIAEKKYNWSSVADGSKFAINSDDDTDLPHSDATRCWKNDDGYDCVNVSCMGDGSTDAAADALETRWAYCFGERKRFASLPSNRTEFGAPDDQVYGSGYKCFFQVYFHENVFLKDEQIASNEVMKEYRDQPWRGVEVEKLMAENSIGGTPHFNCSLVLRYVQNNSLRGFGTTALSKFDVLGA